MLVERNILGNDGVSTFIVEPAVGGRESTVTIQTEMSARTGLAGKIERWLITRTLQPLYQEELRKLEAVAQSPDAA